MSNVVRIQDPNDMHYLRTEVDLATPLRLDDKKNPYLAVQDQHTNKDPDSRILSVVDPLNINGETHIGERRAQRSKPDTDYVPGFPELKVDDIKTMFPFLLHPQNEWVLQGIIEFTRNSCVLGWLYKNLSDERHKALKKKIYMNPAAPSHIWKLYGELPEGAGKAISNKNPFPFGPLMHKVLALSCVKNDVWRITFEDILGLYRELREIALKAQNELGDVIDGINYGSNMGVYEKCGASQPHLHSQAFALTRASFNGGDRLALMCKAYKATYNRDYLADYIEALKRHRLLLDENDNAYLYVPIAQRVNSEVQIMAKAPTVGNILDTTDEILKSIAELEHKAFKAYKKLKLNSFNTVMYATRFSGENDCSQRLIVSIYPRTAKIGFSELSHHWIVDEYPWSSADKIRDVLGGV